MSVERDLCPYSFQVARCVLYTHKLDYGKSSSPPASTPHSFPYPPLACPSSQLLQPLPGTLTPLSPLSGFVLLASFPHLHTPFQSQYNVLIPNRHGAALLCPNSWQCSQRSGGPGGPTGKLPRRLDRTGRQFSRSPVLGHFRTAVLREDHGPHKVRHYYAVLIEGP